MFRHVPGLGGEGVWLPCLDMCVCVNMDNRYNVNVGMCGV